MKINRSFCLFRIIQSRYFGQRPCLLSLFQVSVSAIYRWSMGCSLNSDFSQCRRGTIGHIRENLFGMQRGKCILRFNDMRRTDGISESDFWRRSFFLENRHHIVRWPLETEKFIKDFVLSRSATEGFTKPCGSCRQTLAEFGLDLQVYTVNHENQSQMYTLDELLPGAFTPKDLIKKCITDKGAEQQTWFLFCPFDSNKFAQPTNSRLIDALAVSDMHRTESDGRLRKREALLLFASTPTQQPPSRSETLRGFLHIPLSLSGLVFSVHGARSYHRPFETGYHYSMRYV